MRDFSQHVMDPTFTLTGKSLVEASAGTGKTYNIQNVYLRLLLESDLSVENILVVTFTETATHELRERLRRILGTALKYFDGTCTDTADVNRVRPLVALARTRGEGGTTDEELRGRIRLALMDFDNASIFTIHGFCKRVLDRYAFECGHDPDAELVADETQVIDAVVKDFWRRRTYRDPDFRKTLPLKDVSELGDYVREFLSRPEAHLTPTQDETAPPWDAQAQHLREVCNQCTQRLSDPASFCGKPNAAAQRVIDHWTPNLIEQMGRQPVDLFAVRSLLRDSKKDRIDARWKVSPRVFPAGLQEVVEAAAAGWNVLGTLSGTIRWDGAALLRRANDAPVNLSPLKAAIDEHRSNLAAWLKDTPPDLKSNQTVRAFTDALQQICADTFTWLPDGEAKTFCRQILKPLGAATPDGIFAATAIGLADVCPNLAEAFARTTSGILGGMAGLITELGTAVYDKVRARGVLTYRDLLRNVRQALMDKEAGPRLHRALREEFHAALIDEFQDTDPIQYDIFRDLFGTANTPLFFVGDPKQAIYGFRGGDVFTYYAAKNDVPPDRRQQLPRNYRSEKPLIAAINALFRDPDNGRRTFQHDSIPYDGTLQSEGVPPDHTLTVNGTPDTQPLKLWSYTPDLDSKGNGKVPSLQDHIAMRMYRDVADEIVRLLQGPGADIRIGGRAVQTHDIAVLVGTHSEADLIHAELRKRNINAVRQSTGNVFDTPEATEFMRVVAAMLDPSDLPAIRGALTTSLLPCSDEDLYRYAMEGNEPLAPHAEAASPMEPDTASVVERPASLEDWIELFKDAGARWRQRSFIEAFRFLVNRLDIKPHIVTGPGGERRLTNVLHLAELAHQAASSSRQGPVSLLTWLRQQLSSATRDPQEEHEIRLCSDDDAVTIMTIYKSKGLEFPIVFVPTMWRRKADARYGDDRMLTYHDADGQLLMNLDTDDEAGREFARAEALQEHLRLIYVAVTRAVHRAYLFRTGAGDPQAYALEALLQDRDLSGKDGSAHVAIVPQPSVEEETPEIITLEHDSIDPATLLVSASPHVNKDHGHTSFSSLEPTSHESNAFAIRDRDSGTDADLRAANTQAPQANTDIFSIPGGARTGDCWHAIFERIDFTGNADERAAIVDEELNRHRIHTGPTEAITQARRDAVHHMVHRVLHADMRVAPSGTALRVEQVTRECRRSEMPFHFSLRQTGTPRTTAVIRDVLQAHWGGQPERQPFLDAIATWDKTLPLGFMTGVIDLLCCHADRFYILDWKSNRRSGQWADFGPDGVRDEMARHAYFLQYLFYSVAVHGFLQRELRGYTYTKHFGGVFYVFLRGVTGQSNAGIYADHPPQALIEDLARVLTAAEGAPA